MCLYYFIIKIDCCKFIKQTLVNYGRYLIYNKNSNNNDIFYYNNN